MRFKRPKRTKVCYHKIVIVDDDFLDAGKRSFKKKTSSQKPHPIFAMRDKVKNTKNIIVDAMDFTKSVIERYNLYLFDDFFDKKKPLQSTMLMGYCDDDCPGCKTVLSNDNGISKISEARRVTSPNRWPQLKFSTMRATQIGEYCSIDSSEQPSSESTDSEMAFSIRKLKKETLFTDQEQITAFFKKGRVQSFSSQSSCDKCRLFYRDMVQMTSTLTNHSEKPSLSKTIREPGGSKRDEKTKGNASNDNRSKGYLNAGVCSYGVTSMFPSTFVLKSGFFESKIEGTSSFFRPFGSFEIKKVDNCFKDRKRPDNLVLCARFLPISTSSVHKNVFESFKQQQSEKHELVFQLVPSRLIYDTDKSIVDPSAYEFLFKNFSKMRVTRMDCIQKTQPDTIGRISRAAEGSRCDDESDASASASSFLEDNLREVCLRIVEASRSEKKFKHENDHLDRVISRLLSKDVDFEGSNTTELHDALVNILETIKSYKNELNGRKEQVLMAEDGNGGKKPITSENLDALKGSLENVLEKIKQFVFERPTFVRPKKIVVEKNGTKESVVSWTTSVNSKKDALVANDFFLSYVCRTDPFTDISISSLENKFILNNATTGDDDRVFLTVVDDEDADKNVASFDTVYFSSDFSILDIPQNKRRSVNGHIGALKSKDLKSKASKLLVTREMTNYLTENFKLTFEGLKKTLEEKAHREPFNSNVVRSFYNSLYVVSSRHWCLDESVENYVNFAQNVVGSGTYSHDKSSKKEDPVGSTLNKKRKRAKNVLVDEDVLNAKPSENAKGVKKVDDKPEEVELFRKPSKMRRSNEHQTPSAEHVFSFDKEAFSQSIVNAVFERLNPIQQTIESLKNDGKSLETKLDSLISKAESNKKVVEMETENRLTNMVKIAVNKEVAPIMKILNQSVDVTARTNDILEKDVLKSIASLDPSPLNETVFALTSAQNEISRKMTELTDAMTSSRAENKEATNNVEENANVSENKKNQEELLKKLSETMTKANEVMSQSYQLLTTIWKELDSQ